MPYTKHTWATAETITAALLNNLETQYDEAVAANGQIPTGALAANAVTKISTGSYTGTASTTSTSNTDVNAATTLSVTTSGGELLILVLSRLLRMANPGSSTVVAHFNGTDYDVAQNYRGANNDNTGVPICGVKHLTGVAAGTYTIKARFRASDAAGCDLYDPVIVVIEFKK